MNVLRAKLAEWRWMIIIGVYVMKVWSKEGGFVCSELSELTSGLSVKSRFWVVDVWGFVFDEGVVWLLMYVWTIDECIVLQFRFIDSFVVCSGWVSILIVKFVLWKVVRFLSLGFAWVWVRGWSGWEGRSAFCRTSEECSWMWFLRGRMFVSSVNMWYIGAA